MKLIGLIGGMSWESSAEYYRIVNAAVRDRLGGQHSARVLLYSVDFAEVEQMQRDGRWSDAAALIADAAARLERGGAELLLLCTNTMHCVLPDIEAGFGVPLLHIADAAGRAITAAGLRRIGLLGTRFTMEGAFYRERLQQRFGLDVVIPDEAERASIHRIIYDELCRGQIREPSRDAYRQVMRRMVEQEGVEGFVLGCTEIPLLIGSDDVPWPLFDTTRLHAEWAVEEALATPAG